MSFHIGLLYWLQRPILILSNGVYNTPFGACHDIDTRGIQNLKCLRATVAGDQYINFLIYDGLCRLDACPLGQIEILLVFCNLILQCFRVYNNEIFGPPKAGVHVGDQYYALY